METKTWKEFICSLTVFFFVTTVLGTELDKGLSGRIVWNALSDSSMQTILNWKRDNHLVNVVFKVTITLILVCFLAARGSEPLMAFGIYVRIVVVVVMVVGRQTPWAGLPLWARPTKPAGPLLARPPCGLDPPTWTTWSRDGRAFTLSQRALGSVIACYTQNVETFCPFWLLVGTVGHVCLSALLVFVWRTWMQSPELHQASLACNLKWEILADCLSLCLSTSSNLFRPKIVCFCSFFSFVQQRQNNSHFFLLTEQAPLAWYLNMAVINK